MDLLASALGQTFERHAAFFLSEERPPARQQMDDFDIAHGLLALAS